MVTTFGDKTRTVIYKKEVHKLHEAFAVADGETIHEGELVKLNAAGELIPAILGEPEINVIGYCITKALSSNEPVSVVSELAIAMRGYATILASAKEDGMVPGPVKYAAFDATNNRPFYSQDTVTAANMVGWALIAGDENDEIKVVLK